MPLETAQMLITARVIKGDLPNSTKYNTHRMRNHPCAKWVREDREGFLYAESLLMELCDEYYYRWGRHKGKEHATGIFYKSLPPADMSKMFPHRRRQKPVPLAVGDYPKFSCPIETYRHYYREDKKDFAKWTDRPIPTWY